MSTRTRRELYAKYPWSPKGIGGPMPKWLKTFQHRLQRQQDRERLRVDMDPLEVDPIVLKKGRIQWMWY